MTTDVILYLLTGGFAGFVAGLLGVGGGLIIVPVLYFIFLSQGIDQSHLMHMALATSLATIIVTSISSSIAHHKKHAVLWNIVLLLAPGICIGAWIGGALAAEMNTEMLKPIFGCFELLVAIHLLSNLQTKQHELSIEPVKAYIGGFLIGNISAIVGIGGGTLTVPFLHWHKIAIRNAIATSAACGFPIALAGTASFVYAGWNIDTLPEHTLGYVHVRAFVLIAATSFVFAPLGAKAAHIIPEKILKKGFALFLLLISAKMLFS